MQEYFWWAGRDDEHYTVGPCATREEAIERGKEDFDEGFHIVEAYQAPVDFRHMFEADDAVERWIENDEQLTDEDGNSPFDLTPDQVEDLEKSVRAEIRAWSIRHGLDKIKLYWFGGQRNSEFIPAPEGDQNV